MTNKKYKIQFRLISRSSSFFFFNRKKRSLTARSSKNGGHDLFTQIRSMLLQKYPQSLGKKNNTIFKIIHQPGNY